MREHLQPAHSMTKDLKDVSPTFIARFEFDNTELGRVRLEIEMVQNIGNHDDFSKEEVRWTQIPNPGSQNTATLPLEVNIIGLNGYANKSVIKFQANSCRHISWQLSLSTSTVVERARLTPEMIDFAKAVKFHPPLKSTGAAVTGQRVFDIPGLGHLPITGFEQKTALRYQVRADPDYVFEVARYDMYQQEAGSSKSGYSY